MQSLALDVNVVSEEGQRAELREEDDDLLRAAEELGIDLSGVRAGDGAGANDEQVDGEDDTDAGPPDEQEPVEAPETELAGADIDIDTEVDLADLPVGDED